jgi:hypothetical protein
MEFVLIRLHSDSGGHGEQRCLAEWRWRDSSSLKVKVVGVRSWRIAVASSLENLAISSFHSREEPCTRFLMRTGRPLLLR